MRLASLWVLFALAWTSSAHAELTRALLAPTHEAPAHVAPGGTLSMSVRAASALTPPPGIQEERALKSFAARLCADGMALGTAPARACFALAVTNVRPLSAHSLDYRVDAQLPVWLAPGRYDLGVRFPGGEAEAAASVVVGTAAALAESTRTGEELVLVAHEVDAVVRLHVAGVSVATDAALECFPLPDAAGHLQPAFVALVSVRAGQRAEARTGPVRAFEGVRLALPTAESGQAVQLSVRGAPAGTRVFWWLDAAHSALGPTRAARFVAPRKQPIEALLVEPTRGAALLRGAVPVRARRVGGCAVTRAVTPTGDAGCALSLLALALSWKLGARRRHRAARRVPGT